MFRGKGRPLGVGPRRLGARLTWAGVQSSDLNRGTAGVPGESHLGGWRARDQRLVAPG